MQAAEHKAANVHHRCAPAADAEPRAARLRHRGRDRRVSLFSVRTRGSMRTKSWMSGRPLMWCVRGLHPLLLPTFLVELLPITDMLPTWTGCVALVIGQRRPQQIGPPPPGNDPDH